MQNQKFTFLPLINRPDKSKTGPNTDLVAVSICVAVLHHAQKPSLIILLPASVTHIYNVTLLLLTGQASAKFLLSLMQRLD